MDNFLITGATGFLGSALVEDLLNKGKKVIGIGRKEQGYLTDRVFTDSRFVFIKTDINGDIADILSGYPIDVIVHLAAQQPSMSKLGFDDFYKGNVVTTRAILEFAKLIKVRQIIYASTTAVEGIPAEHELYEENPPLPTDYYGLTKYLAERLIEIELKNTDIQATVVRFPSLYGRNHRGGLIYTYYRLAKEEKPIEVYGNGATMRNALYVDDAVNLFSKVVDAYEALTSFEIFLAGSRDSLSMIKIAECIRDYVSSSSKIVPVDIPPSPPWDIYIDISKAKNVLGFEPTILEEGFKKYVMEMERI